MNPGNDAPIYAIAFAVEGLKTLSCCPRMVTVHISTPIFQYELMETHITIHCLNHGYLAKYTFRQGHNSHEDNMIAYDGINLVGKHHA